MDYLQEIIGEIEVHSVEGIRRCLEHGVTPNDYFKGKPLIEELTSEYARSPRFKECVRIFVDYGLEFDDKILLAVLLDDSGSLAEHLATNPSVVSKRYTLRSAYTPLEQVTLLHICAEFNHLASARQLVRYGADIDAQAGFDVHGFGGQTPVFHTVNQNSNQSLDMLNYLISEQADLKTTVPGLIWGKGYAWETLIPAVNPVSYAMMGLLPQMHRNEETISGVVVRLLKTAYGIDYHPSNVPCDYLKNG
jgi:ankyrin repeat protein